MPADAPPVSASVAEWACWYAETYHWPVVPVHAPTPRGGCTCGRQACPKPGKHPRLRGWQERATTDLAQIRRWFEHDCRGANVGVVTGVVVDALDVDGEAGRASLTNLAAEHGDLPLGPVSLTGGGGAHYLFRASGLSNSVGKLGSGIDWRGRGGQLVLPPSVHASGQRYRWLRSPAEVSLPDVPEWLTRLATTVTPDGTDRRREPIAQRVASRGERNETLFLLASKLRGLDFPEDEALAVLVRRNAKFDPPMNDAELDLGELVRRVYGTYPAGTARDEAKVPVIRFTSITANAEPAGADDWLVEGFLRPNALAVIAAFEGVGKSFIRLQMGVALATGGSFLGRYAAPRPATVGVVDEENGDLEEWRRERDVLAALGLHRADLANYRRTSFSGVVLTSGESQAALDAAVEELEALGPPVVLFFDTATSMVDGKEWGEDLKPAVRYLRGLLRRHRELAIVLLVHGVKPRGERRELGTELADVMGNWTRLVDAVAVMAPVGDGRVRWRTHKKVPPSDIVLARQGALWSFASEYSEKPAGGIDPAALLAFVTEKGSVKATDVVAKFGVSKKTALNAMRGHPGLASEPVDNRGTEVAWPKGRARP